MKHKISIYTVLVFLSTSNFLLAESAAPWTPVNRTLRKTGNSKSITGPTVFAPTTRTMSQLTGPARVFPWKAKIVTTVFWIGEKPSANNPVPNRSSSWDANWTQNYGGYDDPSPGRRRNMIPVAFTPRQNPFYCALPYNDKS